MIITEMIAELEQLQETHGDLLVFIPVEDADDVRVFFEVETIRPIINQYGSNKEDDPDDRINYIVLDYM